MNFNENVAEMSEDTQKDKYLTFSLGKESYGMDIKYVTEIVGIQAITKIPELPDYVKGIINLRGKIIPVIDVRLKFKQAAKEYDYRTCIVITEIMNMSIGLIVDSVSEVLKIMPDKIVDPPNMNNNSNNKYIKKIGNTDNGVKLLLDCEKLLTDDNFQKDYVK